MGAAAQLRDESDLHLRHTEAYRLFGRHSVPRLHLTLAASLLPAVEKSNCKGRDT